jgi:ribonucleoside-diphosphate reductase alpha chain
MNDYQTLIAMSRYSKWNGKRRETWEETVERFIDNIVKPKISDKKLIEKIRKYIVDLEVMPSMRAVMTAGEALTRDNISMFNCSYLPIDDYKCFDEAMYILMCGTGVGFSVEEKYVEKLPTVSENFEETETLIKVADSKIGWATAFRELISLLYSGKIPQIDVSKVRARGERLKTFGGRASGPEPLVDLFKFCINLFSNASGRKLTTLEVHSIMCKVGEIVVVGGVRRSALISLSDLNDNSMRYAKSGDWWSKHPEFRLANNSAVYTKKPDICGFLEEWKSIYSSKSGERGIFNREAVIRKIKNNERRDESYDFGTNPCSEISLRPYGLCNLTEVVVRAHDTEETLTEKVKIATLLGTIQSLYTNFRYLRKIWRKNAEEENLLGVSMTGIFDNPLTYTLSTATEQMLDRLRNVSIEENKKWAKHFDIKQSAAITCVKPSGTVSQLCNCGSGIHPRYAKKYIRSVRQNTNDPITAFLKAGNIYNEKCVFDPQNTTVFYFPIEAEARSVTRKDISALEHLKTWLMYNNHWSEHQVSITVSVKEEEWLPVAAFVYENFNQITGISFLPYDGGTYKQAPYTDCTDEEFEELANKNQKIDWTKLEQYEQVDNTEGTQTLACVAGGCDI